MQIKFRGWNTQEKIMYSSQELGADQLTISCHGMGFINVNSVHTKLSTYCDHIIPLQSTGINDKNGKEAHHKDIVRMSIFLYTIEWCDKSAKFYLKSINNIDGMKYSMTKLSRYGVIEGNIFENPELLEKSPC
jgi:uncharacterized phage protein (TIGR01671 family)